MLTSGAPNSVDSLPRDEHGHDRGFARASGKLQRETLQFRVGIQVRRRKMFQYVLPGDKMRRDLSKPDESLDGLDLTIERTNIVKLVMPPMLQKVGGFGCDLSWSR